MNKYLLLFYLLLYCSPLYSQNSGDVYVDDNGILKWEGNNKEVSLFGVNYTAPFAYSFRALKKLNISIKDAIDIDIYHMKRLGFNAYRIHVWDREVSDSAGNLLNNEHLDLFDYLLKKLSDNGIKTILTPIAWWGTGWPESDLSNPGFSQNYSKVELITKNSARAAQRNYLKQFINHVNPYTKLSYKDDPLIIAMEIINEPRHPNNADSVTVYINEMYDVMRNAGYKKPIYYNISENWSDVQAQAVSSSKAEGISFQWYPTALVHNNMLNGNFLVNVNKYKIPSEDIKGYTKKTKMVYEFDAADIGGSYMYPAMARSFREAGMQFATMFSYDPAFIAWSNTEYPTHFLNLLYTPPKAISLMIAGKAFQRLPLYKDYGEFPANNSFDVFRVSYEEDLSEMNTETEFYYSNNTDSKPTAPDKLTHIAGVGSSPVVKYNGTGAYFLDRINDNMWILEIFPDALWIDDPFGKTSPDREVARLFISPSDMQIKLPVLNPDFHCTSLLNKSTLKANNATINITPGKYIISNQGIPDEEINLYTEKHNDNHKLYIPENAQKYFVINNTTAECTEGKIKFTFNIASEDPISEAVLHFRRPGWRGFEKHLLTRTGKYKYEVMVNSPALKGGMVEYCVSLKTNEGYITFPGEEKNNPEEWDFSAKDLWRMKINPVDLMVLFDPVRDYEKILYPHFNPTKYFTNITTNANSGDLIYSIRIQSAGKQSKPFGFMNNVSSFTKNSTGDFDTVVIKARLVTGDSGNISINFLFNDGKSLSAPLRLKNAFQEIKIPITEFKPSKRLILPDSYPLFLSKLWKQAKNLNSRIDFSRLDFLQLTFDEQFNYEIEIQGVTLH